MRRHRDSFDAPAVRGLSELSGKDMNGSISNILSAVRVGLIALSFAAASSFAGEPIIMGTQRIASDPGARPRLDDRLEQGGAIARSSNPINGDSGMPLSFMPPPAAAPSKRSQSARDEKENWMVLNPGDLTDAVRSSELFGDGSMSPEKNSGRRDYFFERSEGRSAAGSRQPVTGNALDLVNRAGLAMANPSAPYSRQDEEETKRRAEDSRESGNPADNTTGGRKSIEEPGLGPLLDPGRVSGAQGIERWSASINQALQRRKIDGVNDPQTKREQYLDYLGNAQYSGANYPANTEWGKYQREWAGSAADARAASSPGLLGGSVAGASSSKPTVATPGAASSSGVNRPGAAQGNLSGMGTLPSYLQQRSAPSRAPKVDYSLPKDPGSSFNFR
jgi:hypothetical protein